MVFLRTSDFMAYPGLRYKPDVFRDKIKWTLCVRWHKNPYPAIVTARTTRLINPNYKL